VRKDFDPAGVLLLDPTKVRVVTLGSEEFLQLETARRGKKRLFYSAKAGDTLAKLGRRYGLTPGDLARINRFSYNTELREGDRVVVYSPTGDAPHEVTRGMTPGEKRPGRATAAATATTGPHKTIAETDHKLAAPLHDSKKKVAIAAVKPAPAKPARAKPASPGTATATANATAKKK
jgi:membrane-bound lytic murein transglycosylase D